MGSNSKCNALEYSCRSRKGVILLSDVISRKVLHADIEDIVFRYKGETRIGREFNFNSDLSEIDHLIELQKRYSTDLVIFPDRRHLVADNRICLSVSADRVAPFSGKRRNFNELLEPLDELHRAGFLHLGLTSDSYMITDDRCVLMVWGDALITSVGKVVPEVACGGFPCEGSDYYSLGNLLSSNTCRIWDGTDAPDLKMLKHWRLSNRMEVLGRLPYRIPRTSLPAAKSFMVICGGSWKERDIILDEYLCSASRKSWQTAVIRCRIQESHRPLPGSRLGRNHNSPRKLMESSFSNIEGVSKLLVVDQIDYASEDLKAILRELSETLASDLSVIITSSSCDLSFLTSDMDFMQLDGVPSSASILDPCEALKMDVIPCYPFRTESSFQLRTDCIDNLEKVRVSSRQLFDEGAFRFLVSQEGRRLIEPDHSYILEDSLIEFGMLEEALEVIPDDNHIKRGIIFQKKADYLAAVSAFEKAVSAGSNPSSLGLPYISSLVEIGEREKAKEFLKNLDDTESVIYMSWILDCEGRIKDAFDVLDRTLSRTVSEDRIPLLIAKGSLFLRTGEFDRALIAVTEAKMLADESVEQNHKIRCHQELGRTLESMGLWQDALDNYRIASYLSRESNDPEYIERLVHRYVLEFRMGNIKLARNTLQEIKSMKRAETSKIYQQRISMIEAYSGVLLCQGEAAIDKVNEALSISSDLQRTLMTGLCMMYKGQLLIQAGSERDGQKFLEQAKAVGLRLGDKYLILASELALCYIQKPSNPDEMLQYARDINLKQMELIARVIFNTGRLREEAFEEILDLPDPLKACELATYFGPPTELKSRNRLLASYRNVRDMLGTGDRKLFMETHAVLQEMLDTSGEDLELYDISLLRNQIAHLSEWIKAYTSGQADIMDLCSTLGLNCSDTLPIGCEYKPVEIYLPDGESLFITGEDIIGASVLEPVISSVMGICNSQSNPIRSDERDFPEIITRSTTMKNMKHRMRKVAGTMVPVLITGETGTGKELVAEAIHQTSGSAKQFVAVDCGAIPENLIESELFGSIRGSYTDSKHDRQGLIEAANGGTLFLDEIGNMPLQLQSKLLRVLETGVLRRIGETLERRVDFRLISATNSNLYHRMDNGKFRSDLYYRIAVMVIDIPPLRNRTGDIPLLVSHFANSFTETDKRPPRFLHSSINKMCSYKWPGNVRELRNVVHRAILLSDGKVVRESEISFENYTPVLENVHYDVSMQKLDDVVTKHVYRVYRKLNNKTRAAGVLGCDPKTVTKYIGKYEEKYR